MSQGYIAKPGAKLVELLPNDASFSGVTTTMTVGESVTFGDALYIKSDGKLWLGDADAETTTPVIALATGSADADDEIEVLLCGFMRNDSWNWTVGSEIYVSETAGDITQTAPSDTGDVVQIVGIATHADRMYFNPSLINVVLA